MNLSASFSRTKRGERAIARAIACAIMLLVLPSCGIPDRRHAEPGPPLPTSFNGTTSAENSALLGVEEFYRDPTLLSLIDQAVANNRELKILNEEVQIASSEILARSGAYLPFLSAGPNVGLDRASNRSIEGAALRDDPYLPGKFFSNPHGNFLLGVNFTWQVDIYRQLRNARDAAARRYVAAIERRNAFVTRMVAQVAENYFQLMALDKRLENLNQIIEFQEQSLRVAQARKEAARDTELAVLRFQAEVRRNQAEKLSVNQDIIEAENRINFLANRFPQPVARDSSNFYDLNINSLGVGVPSQLLQNRPDIRQAERELEAAGLDVKVARVNFYPQLVLNSGVGLYAFNVQDLFEPQAVVGNIAGGLIGPLVNRRAIRAQYLANNARQMQAIYDYQRTLLNAFTEVVNRLTEVQNYSRSVEIRKQQLASLESAVNVANNLFQFARTEYLDVLTAQRDLRDGRTALIDNKQQQLTAVVYAYQALGGGALLAMAERDRLLCPIPHTYKPNSDDDFWALSQIHYGSGRYFKALEASLDGIVPYRDYLNIGDTRLFLPANSDFGPPRIQGAPADRPSGESTLPPTPPPLPPPPNAPGPFGPPGPEVPGPEAGAGTPPAEPVRP